MFIRVPIGWDNAPNGSLPMSQRGHLSRCRASWCSSDLLPAFSLPHLLNLCFIASFQLGAMQHKLSKRLMAASMVHLPRQTLHPRPRYHHRLQTQQSVPNLQATQLKILVTLLLNPRTSFLPIFLGVPHALVSYFLVSILLLSYMSL